MKDGKELVNDGKQISIKQDGDLHTLTVTGVQRGDAGNIDIVNSWLGP